MHYSLVTYGSRGDIQPFVALALGLMAKGHKVTLAAPENFNSFITSYGVGFYPLHGDAEALVTSPGFSNAVRSGSNLAFLKVALKKAHQIRGPLFDGICKACESADAIIVVNTCVFYAAAIAERFNKKWLIVQLNPPMIPTRAFPMLMHNFPDIAWLNPYSYRLINSILWRLGKKDALELRQRLGLPLLKGSLYNKIMRDKVPMIHAYSPELITTPDDWDEAYSTAGFFYLPNMDKPQVALPDDLSAWLQAGNKPLYIGFGSIPFPDESKLIATITAILSTSDTRILFCQGWSHISGLPSHPNLFVVKQTNHTQLFPKCRAAIIHGGIGTVAAVIKAGVPAIVASIFVDQPVWGKIVQEKKLGIHIPWRKLSAKSVLKALAQLAQPDIAETVRQVSGRINKEDGVGAAVEVIEAYCN